MTDPVKTKEQNSRTGDVMVYLRGFQSINNRRVDDDPDVFVYDRQVEMLYRSYINNEIDSNNWGFRVSVFEEAYRLFSQNFEEWTMYQINRNTLVYDHNLEFLIDTLNFINGKPRTLSPYVWREMMLHNPENKSTTEIANRRIRKLKDLYPKMPSDTAKVLQMWCSQSTGFDDLLVSLFLFFGPSIKNNNQAISAIKVF